MFSPQCDNNLNAEQLSVDSRLFRVGNPHTVTFHVDKKEREDKMKLFYRLIFFGYIDQIFDFGNLVKN